MLIYCLSVIFFFYIFLVDKLRFLNLPDSSKSIAMALKQSTPNQFKRVKNVRPQIDTNAGIKKMNTPNNWIIQPLSRTAPYIFIKEAVRRRL